MRYLSLILFMFLVVGCTEPDPWRAAIAQERSVIAHNAQAQTAAQIEQGQSADADRRNAQTRLEGLQTQNAIVQGQAVVAHSNAISSIVASTNETTLLLADKMIEATRPDYTPLYGAMMGVVMVVVTWIMANRRNPVVVAPQAQQSAPATPEPPQRADKPVMVYMTEHAFAYRLPDETIILHRYRDGKERVYLPADPFYQRLLTGGKQ